MVMPVNVGKTLKDFHHELPSQLGCKQYHPTETNESYVHAVSLTGQQNEPIQNQVLLDTRTRKHCRLPDKIPHCSTLQKLQKGNPTTTETDRTTLICRAYFK